MVFPVVDALHIVPMPSDSHASHAEPIRFLSEFSHIVAVFS